MTSDYVWPPLVLRADATPASGLGHLTRLLALGQAWLEHGGQATLITHCTSDAVRRQVRSSGVSLVPLPASHPHVDDLNTTRLTLEDAGSRRRSAGDAEPWLVLDGYHFTPEYLASLRETTPHLAIYADDGAIMYADVDVVVNQNLGAEQFVYRTRPHTVRLLGPQYVAIRREFLPWQRLRRETPAMARRLLVTLGGSDPGNVTLLVMQALRTLAGQDYEARVVAGPANPHLRQLRQRTAECSGKVELVTDPTRMPELMAWADLAVTAPGSTCWEMCCLGLPHGTISVNPIQAAVAEALDRAGQSVHLGGAGQLTAESVAAKLETMRRDAGHRQRLSERGQVLIDGAGADRVAQGLLGISAPWLVEPGRRHAVPQRGQHHAAA
jgi:UDP-2,4-diacetamido-2,4,6-trideoxy-beta-L-altropyranose hydrolase